MAKAGGRFAAGGLHSQRNFRGTGRERKIGHAEIVASDEAAETHAAAALAAAVEILIVLAQPFPRQIARVP